jgi:hypothetical protein
VPATTPGTRLASAAGLAIIIPDPLWAPYTAYLRQGATQLRKESPSPQPAELLITPAAATRLLGRALEGARPGTTGRTVRGEVAIADSLLPARNVIAVLPGSDPRLRGEYVAIGAHSDHIGLAKHPVDHDSLRAFDTVLRPQGLDGPPAHGTPEQLQQVHTLLDSLRLRHQPRPDSINNGADDDGSGSMAVLEMAEELATTTVKPKRSMLFIWHTGEELGMLGSEWFTDHPTVPRDSIVTELNIDMIGRGGASDIQGGGPAYLQLIGSRRLSTELGRLIEAVNRDDHYGFTFDYTFDANGDPEQYYCRSDHYEYARYGIPIAFFSTGSHRDYHMVTDEPQYIDYDHYARVTRFIHDVALRVANLDHRIPVDHPKPDPKGPCVQ